MSRAAMPVWRSVRWVVVLKTRTGWHGFGGESDAWGSKREALADLRRARARARHGEVFAIAREVREVFSE